MIIRENTETAVVNEVMDATNNPVPIDHPFDLNNPSDIEDQYNTSTDNPERGLFDFFVITHKHQELLGQVLPGPQHNDDTQPDIPVISGITSTNGMDSFFSYQYQNCSSYIFYRNIGTSRRYSIPCSSYLSLIKKFFLS